MEDDKETWIPARRRWGLVSPTNSLRLPLSVPMSSLWLRRQHVSERLRLRLYNAFVRPVLLYNAGTWGLTGSETDKLNAFHRKQLRLLNGIKWLQRISNSNLYERFECREIGTDVMWWTSWSRPTFGRESACEPGNVSRFRNGGTSRTSRPTQNQPHQDAWHRPAADGHAPKGQGWYGKAAPNRIKQNWMAYVTQNNSREAV